MQADAPTPLRVSRRPTSTAGDCATLYDTAMSTPASREVERTGFVGNDRVLFGIIFGVLAFWLFAQTTLNISPAMAEDLGIGTNVMNIAVSITALFSGIFIVVVGSLADRFGRVKMVQIGFVLSIAGSLLVGLAPAGSLAPTS